MTFPPARSLKPLEPPGFPAPAKGLGTKRLSPLDMMGVIARPKEGTPATGAPGAAHDREQLVRSTQQWVAQTFFGALMKQMRESPFKSELFEGGRGGQAFTSLYDQKLVEQMARGAGNKLVNAVVHQIEKNMRKAQAGAAYDKHKGAAAAVEAKQAGRAVEAARGGAFNHVRADVPAAFGS